MADARRVACTGPWRLPLVVPLELKGINKQPSPYQHRPGGPAGLGLSGWQLAHTHPGPPLPANMSSPAAPQPPDLQQILPSEYAARTWRLTLQAAAGAAGAVLCALGAITYTLRSFPAWQLLCAWLLSEVAFAFYYAGKLRCLNVQPAAHRPADHDGVATANRFMRLRKFFPFSESYLRPWFK